MLNRIIVCALALVFCVMAPLSALAQQDIALESKLITVETMIYGAPLAGGILERTDRLEEHVYGESYVGSILQRIDVLYAYTVETTEASPSMLTKMNAAEWMITKKVTNDPIQTRISNLEKILGGSPIAGSLDERLDNLAKVTFVGGQIEIIPAILAKDSLIRVKILSPLNSKQNKDGDTVEVAVNEDVFIGSVLIIPQGAKGTGKIVKARPAKNFGRDATLQISIDSIDCINGSDISTFIGDKANEQTMSLTKATGASVAGIALLGPVGIIGGAFVSGKNIDIPAGAELYVQTKADQDLFGVTVK